MIELHTFEDITLFKWDRFIATNDANWFRVDFDGRQAKIDTPELNTAKDAIVDAYFNAVENKAFENKMKAWAKIDYLKVKHQTVSMLLDRMFLGFADFQMETRLLFIRELKSHGYKMQEINTIEGDFEEIKRLRNALEGIKTQIAVLSQGLQKEAVADKNNLSREMILVSMGLQLGYQINAKTTLLTDWIEMCKLLKEKQKQN